MQTLAAWPAAASLQWLDISENKIPAAGARALAASPYLARLKRLNANSQGAAILQKKFGKRVVP